jgi:hypothetical protein
MNLKEISIEGKNENFKNEPEYSEQGMCKAVDIAMVRFFLILYSKL